MRFPEGAKGHAHPQRVLLPVVILVYYTMLKKLYIIVFLLVLPVWVDGHAGAYTDPDDATRSGAVEDVIDVHVADGEVVAVRDGRHVHRENLGLREAVLWKSARGHVGAVLTNRRLLAVSRTTPGWRSRTLRLEEADDDSQPDMLISDFLVMAVTPRRIILFDGLANAWATKDIPLHDNVSQVAIDNHVAVIITDKRIYGVAARRGRFVEQRIASDEAVVSVTTRPHSVTVRTGRQLLIFRSRSPFWERVGLG